MDKKVIIYGAGKRAKYLIDFLESLNIEQYVCCFCDKDAENINNINGVPVILPEEAKLKGQVFWVSIADETIREQVVQELKASGCTVYNDLFDALEFCGCTLCRTEFNRLCCAFWHQNTPGEDYYNVAETSLNIFWDIDSAFYGMFQSLDLSNVIELACGHGRHVARYINRAKHVTLVDILQSNIDYCKNRYKQYDNISYYKNNGYNLQKLDDNRYTSLFVYDAMVHFEMFDIYDYLKDMHRVLKPGAMALFHHSNNYDAQASFFAASGGRNFMSKELFKYLAFQTGFEVVQQEVIDWVKEDLDCISLLRKP